MNLEQAEIKSSIIQSMAHPVRLIIVEALAGGEMKFSELTDFFTYDKSTISKHLSILKGKGIVSSYKNRTESIYKLEMCCFDAFLQCIDSIIEQNVKNQECCIVKK